MNRLIFNKLDHIPNGLLDCDATQLHQHLGGPTLIHLPGRRQEPLFVSILMHGNETTGWDAMRKLLVRYKAGGGDQELPRSLLLFIGNTLAAEAGVRHLPDQPDYNRVWPGSELPESEEHIMMQSLVDHVRGHMPFASIDVHNNTGMNPHYACINVFKNSYMHLASLFGRIVVYFVRPKGVASMAMADLCPSVTLECGKTGGAHGEEHAMEYIEACLRLAELPEHPISPHDIDLFHTMAIVKIPENVDFAFNDESAKLNLIEDIDKLNFRELPAGTAFGRLGTNKGIPLDVKDETGRDVSQRYFKRSSGELVTRMPLMPSMLTRDAEVIKQDCLCYIMERYNDHLSEVVDN